MDKDSVLTTLWLDSVPSTQTYLLDALKSEEITMPTLLVASNQTQGKGSRGNDWIGLEGNLFFSFCLEKNMLPEDLPLSATSIYFSFLLKKVLADMGSAVWMKWPNDFYINGHKIGGTITNISSKWFVCGIGLNLVLAPESFAHLDITIDKESLFNEYKKSLNKLPSWKKILKEFEVEFAKSKRFSTHVEGEQVALSDAKLANDGALLLNGQRIYSLR